MNIEDIASSITASRPLLDLLHESTDEALYQGLKNLECNDIDLLTVLEELLLNAREHGKPPVRLFLSKRIGGTLYFTIDDQGVGIHETIPHNPNLSDTRNKSPSSIVRLACEEGITGTGQKGRGVGLYLLSSFCRVRNAEMLIRTDAEQVMQVHDVFLEKKLSQSMTGTLICLKVKI